MTGQTIPESYLERWTNADHALNMLELLITGNTIDVDNDEGIIEEPTYVAPGLTARRVRLLVCQVLRMVRDTYRIKVPVIDDAITAIDEFDDNVSDKITAAKLDCDDQFNRRINRRHHERLIGSMRDQGDMSQQEKIIIIEWCLRLAVCGCFREHYGSVHNIGPLVQNLIGADFKWVIHHIFGPNPFTQPLLIVNFDRVSEFGQNAMAVLTDIYETGNFADTPIIADALMDHGYDNTMVIEHLRRGGCMRGCHVIDWMRQGQTLAPF